MTKLTEKTEEFLPCPFCGVGPTIISSNFKWMLLHHCEAVKSAISRGRKQDLLKKWNKRS